MTFQRWSHEHAYRKFGRWFGLGILFLGMAVEPGFPQLPTATILGVVKDASGAVVPGATLTVRNRDTGLTRTAAAGADGSYRFSALPVGTYEIRVEQPGFQAALRTELVLTVGLEAVMNFSLTVGAIEQQVSVTAEAPLVNTTSGSLGGLVDEQKVAELPLNGRNFVDLTLLQTGIAQHKNVGSTATLRGVFYSSNGAPVRSNNYLLDGAVMVNLYGATAGSVAGTTLGVEGIREYRVVTNSFSAEYGMTMGSQMTIVSKSGTNTFHGSLFEYLRNSALDARNFFDYKSAATKPDFRLPAFQRNNFGAAFGGPIKKDHTFFHVVYEELKERLGVTTIDNVIPTSAKVDGGAGGVPQISPLVKPWLALFPEPNLPKNQFTFPATQPTDENYGQVRLDQTISNNDNLFGRYTVDDTRRTAPLAYPQFTDSLLSRSQFATLSENHIFSPTLLNISRFSFSRTNLNGQSSSGFIGPQYSLVAGSDIGTIGIGGVTSLGPDGANPTIFKQNVFTWSDDLAYTHGKHSLKFGILMNHYQMYIESSLTAKGSISFANLTAFLLAQPTNYSAASRRFRTYHMSTVGFYMQDDFRWTSRLTLNLGMRYEFMTVPVEQNGQGVALRDMQHDASTTLGPPFQNPSLKNFSPRFGFAWDVGGDGKTALRGGFGLLYDVGNVGSMLLQGAQMPPFATSSSVVSSPSPAPPLALTLPLFFPPSSFGKSMRAVDYSLQQPHMLQYNLTLERQLPGNMALTLAYGGSRGINLVQMKEGNPTIPQILPDGQEFWTGKESRVNPNWANILLFTGDANSWYNSLQFGLTKRLSKGLQFQSSYTWAKTIDEIQGQLPTDNTGTSSPTDPLHRNVDRGLADFNIAHNWKFNAIYRLPELVSGGALGKLVNGWWMSGIVSLQTGYGFSPMLTSNRSQSKVGGSNADRANLVAGRSNDNITSGTSTGCMISVAGTLQGVASGTKLGTPNLWFDPCAFAIQPAGFLGTAGRNILTGPGFANLDFSLVKDMALRHLGEAGQLEFRAEVFNLLNHANFAMPSAAGYAGVLASEPPLATAGRITSTAGSSRQIQLALRLSF